VTLLRVFSKIDDKNKITIPRGVRRELNIKPGDRLELTLGGINNARKLLVSKPKGR
jgi:AbrB family looped-hinge helix DNA binding protein